MNRIRFYGPSLILLLTVLTVLVAGPIAVRQIAWAQTDAKISLIRNELSQNEALANLSESFRRVAKVVEPSVVHVEVLSRSPRGPGGMRGPMGEMPDMFRRFFGPQGPRGQFRRPDQPRQPDPYQQYDPAMPAGNGSGWVYDDQGHIITNNHVVAHADAIRVRMYNGAEYKATVVGTDPSTDVAVLKVEADNLHPAAIAREPAQTGDLAFAFGSPFGFKFSMSQGIISAKGRTLHILGPGGYENFIQTDAAINPGNSGGPLTNIYGEVVGMNTAIASRSPMPGAAGFMGLGFAIPVQMVTRVADQIIEDGSVSRGYLGVYIDDLEAKMAESFGYDGDGVLVVGPTETDSPAAEAGVRSGDIITSINGNAVASADDLRYLIAGLPPGSEVEVGIFRNGETQTFTVTLGELPTRGMASRSLPGDDGQGEEPEGQGMDILEKYGIEGVQTFTRQLAQRIGVAYHEGVLITAVRDGSRAERDGLARGMLLAGVQGEPVETVDDLVDRVSEHDPVQGIRLKVQIWNPATESFAPRFVLLELPPNE